ncbi:MAG: YidC/Oxa1 family membrane protein insertase [Candidatus Moranbacteria bacterium]|nr:YidC/Oxa1 family membrane protein insertase [Candidatus Moranbacteria bacterium]MDZ4385446.1 YidC/Oxa1 family membrane protein insertase [Candidatus Moranbacteria bacterium]
MSFLFDTFVYYPIYNLLIFIYNIIPDFGVAIIILTVLIKFLLFPLSKKQIESQKKMQELQPKIKAIQGKYKNDKEKQSRAMMELYKESGSNPFSGCLPMIAQLVFLIAIYRVLFNISQAGLIINQAELYSFIANPGQINKMFVGIVDLASAIEFSRLTLGSLPHILLVILAAGAQFIQTKMMMAKQPIKAAVQGEPDFSEMMTKQMLFLGPLLTLFIGIKFPAGLALYWLVSTVFMILQQRYMEKKETSVAVIVAK